MLLIGISLIIIEQFKRIKPEKILMAAIYFIIVYELYIFKNSVAGIFILGPIMIYLFYEALELFDRRIISQITYIIVGLLLKNGSVSTLTYIVFHWIVVRLGLLYFVFLPLFDNHIAFIVISTIGFMIFLYNIAGLIGIIDVQTEE